MDRMVVRIVMPKMITVVFKMQRRLTAIQFSISSPIFSFSELATVLKQCWSDGECLNVRDGVYEEEFIIANIQGNSFTNT